MKCDVCKVNEATVHLTEVINENVTKLHLCEECAKEKSVEMQSHFGLSDLLSGLMEFEPSVPGSQVESDLKVKCPVCGLSFQDFQKDGRLGCGKCYDTFGKKLGELLRKIHGSDKHIGKIPFIGKDMVKEQEDVKRLRDELNKLIQAEEFEKAAFLRDRIKELEKKFDNQE